MKRSPIARRTPLISHSVLRRGGPLNPFSDKRRKANGERRVVVAAMRELAAGRCARCGRADLPVHGHERVRRSQGGDILAPDCLLCNQCNGWAASGNVPVACWTGWAVSPKHPHDPALSPWEARALDGSIVDLRALSPVGGAA